MKILKIIRVMLFLLVHSRIQANNLAMGAQDLIVPDLTLLTSVCETDTGFNITGGVRKGTNLFHSFNRFSVDTGKTAIFSNEFNVTTDNIINRVTGNIRSEINGIIRANEASGFKNVNFYLLNPAGVTLGSGATLDIEGSVHLSTADYTRFEDGNTFNVGLDTENMLTTAKVSAFGFLKSTDNLTIPSSILLEEVGGIQVEEGKSLSLVGGDINIIGSNLTAPGGKIYIVNVAYGEEVTLDPALSISSHEADGTMTRGDISIVAGQDSIDPIFGSITPNPTIIDVKSNNKKLNSGSISIRGGIITLDQSKVSSRGSDDINAGTVILAGEEISLLNGAKVDVGAVGAGAAGNIDILATEKVKLKGEGKVDTGGPFTQSSPASILASNSGDKNAGIINIKSPTLEILEDAEIRTSSSGEGPSGSINLEVDTTRIDGGGEITASTSSKGTGGTIAISGYTKHASKKVIINQGEISTKTTSTGPAGNIRIYAKQVIIEPQGTISSSNSQEDAQGLGGKIIITDSQLIEVKGTVTTSTKSKLENAKKAGDIVLQTEKLLVHNVGSISSKSEGSGNAGNINIKISELKLDNGSITTDASDSDGGDIIISGNSPAKFVSLRNSSAITATVNGGPETTGGNINIDSDLIIAQNSQIIANAFEGSGGNINIKTQGLFVDPNSQISASSDRGIDGTVEIDAAIEVIDGVLGLPETYMSNLKLRQETCAKRLGADKTSSFTIVEKSGMPISPEAMLSADYSNYPEAEKNVTIESRYIKNHDSTNGQFDINCRNRNTIPGE